MRAKTINEIIAIARQDYLKDIKAPYQWSDSTLLLHANEAQEDACERRGLIRDSKTASICQITPVASQSEYLLHPKVTRVVEVKPSANTYPLTPVTRDQLDHFYPEWRPAEGVPVYFLPEIEGQRIILTLVPYPTSTDLVLVGTLNLVVYRKPRNAMVLDEISVTGSSDISFSASASTITSAGSVDFLNLGFLPLCPVRVSGTSNNNGNLTALNVTPTVITVAESLTNEDDTSAVLKTNSVLEIPRDLHLKIIHGICTRAYAKDGADEQDYKRSMFHEGMFTQTFGPKVSANAMRNRAQYPRNLGLKYIEFGF